MPTSKGHILVVEPNGITRKLIAGILSARGYETYEAVNGDEALGFLAKAPVLIILDVDGDNPSIVGLLHKLKRDHGRLATVAMSDEQDIGVLKARLGLQNISVLEKPVVPESLLNSIESHLLSGVEAGIGAGPKQAPRADDPLLRDQREGFMRRAIDLAQEKMDKNCGGPFGAVVVKGGKIVGEGWDSVLSEKDPTAHAEIMAIRAAARATGDYALGGCEIYTSCEPCPMCMAAIYWARIDRVFYANTVEDAREIGFDTEFIYRELAQPEHKRTLPAKMLLRDEAKIVFENWMKKGDRTGY